MKEIIDRHAEAERVNVLLKEVEKIKCVTDAEKDYKWRAADYLAQLRTRIIANAGAALLE